MTTWRQYKDMRPLRGGAARAYQRERAAMGIGYLILKARAEAGMSQQHLADAVGTTQPMIARWESGAQVPNMNSLLRIADATGFDLAVGLHRPKAPKDQFATLGLVRPTDDNPTFHIVSEESPPYDSRVPPKLKPRPPQPPKK